MFLHYLADFGIFLETTLVDLSMAGDNAILLAMAVQHIPAEERKMALAMGAGAGALLRCGLAIIVAQLLQIPGLSLVGGLLLLWVCYTLYKTITHPSQDEGIPAARSKWDAVLKIIIADLSMSLDNVLGVAGATANHPMIMTFGIILSVVLIILVTEKITLLLNRYPWLNWAGLIIILFVSAQMIYHGVLSLIPTT